MVKHQSPGYEYCYGAPSFSAVEYKSKYIYSYAMPPGGYRIEHRPMLAAALHSIYACLWVPPLLCKVGV